MEKRLRCSIRDEILNDKYHNGEVWSNVTDGRMNYLKNRKDPFNKAPCWKSANTTCLGKYKVEINGYEARKCEEVSNQWDKVSDLPRYPGWKVWFKEKNTIYQYANQYYGGVRYEFRIQAKKRLVEPSRLIVSTLVKSSSGLPSGRSIGEVLWGEKAPTYIVDVVGSERFRMETQAEIQEAFNKIWSGGGDTIHSYHWDIWAKGVNTVLKDNGYPNVSFEFIKDGKGQYSILEWVVL
jgi:hypothetical protein